MDELLSDGETEYKFSFDTDEENLFLTQYDEDGRDGPHVVVLQKKHAIELAHLIFEELHKAEIKVNKFYDDALRKLDGVANEKKI